MRKPSAPKEQDSIGWLEAASELWHTVRALTAFSLLVAVMSLAIYLSYPRQWVLVTGIILTVLAVIPGIFFTRALKHDPRHQGSMIAAMSPEATPDLDPPRKQKDAKQSGDEQ